MKKWVEEKVALSRRAARPSQCARCGESVLRGLDNDQCAFVATVDPEPVTVEGELLAIAQGRWTYDGHRGGTGQGIELVARTADMLTCRTADVFADHRCGSPLPRQPASVTAASKPLPEIPPF